MRNFISIFLLLTLALVATTVDSQAGWKKRGWYQKRPGANCVMRKVVISGYDGTVIVKKVRVCR